MVTAWRAEENVDQVVAGDAIQAVVPLLTFYGNVEGDGAPYQCAPVAGRGLQNLCAVAHATPVF